MKVFCKSCLRIVGTGDHATPFPMGIIWNPWIPSKERFLDWEACRGKVFTLDQLRRRG